MAEVLAARGADVNARDTAFFTPLHDAASYNSYKTAKVLLSHGADINAKNSDINGNQTPLHRAIGSNNNKEFIDLLVENGVDINAKDRGGRTPLQLTIENFHYSFRSNPLERDHFNLLIKKGADWKTIDNEGNTLLHTAVKYSFLEGVKFLLSKGADIEARNKAGETPMHMVGQVFGVEKKEDVQNSIKIAELLLSKGADINMKDSTGRTPLHSAVRGRKFRQLGARDTYDGFASSIEIVEFLINKGADVNARDYGGKRPLKTARSFQINNIRYFEALDGNKKYLNKSDICQILLRHGAKE